MDTIVVLFAAVYAVLLGIGAWAQRGLSAFLEETPTIADSRALERFKQVARHNMYGALVQIALGLVGLLAGIGVVSRHGLPGLAGITAANAALFALGRRVKTLESRARSLPASSPELERQHRYVGEVWMKRPLPDF